MTQQPHKLTNKQTNKQTHISNKSQISMRKILKISLSYPGGSPEEVKEDRQSNDHNDDKYQDHITCTQRISFISGRSNFYYHGSKVLKTYR